MTIEVQTKTTPREEASRPCPEFAPAVDIIEHTNTFAVVADVPGADENGVEVRVENETLTISARVVTQEPQGMDLLHRGYEACNYHRAFTLPQGVERAKISAQLKQGVLRVLLPKAAEVQPLKIKVDVGK